MRLNNRLIGVLIVAAAALLLCSVAQAGTIYQVTPGGPYTAWFPLLGDGIAPDSSGNVLFGGDVYNDGTGTTSDWDVQSIIVWAAGSMPIDPVLYGDVITTSSTAPFLGQVEGSLFSITSAGSYVSASSGNTVPIWQLVFNVPDLVVPADSGYEFAVLPASGGPTALLMSTGCLGSPPDIPNTCASWGIMEFATNGDGTYNVGALSGTNTFGDVNIILSDAPATSVPEPASLLLLGAGIGVIGLVRRRRG